MNRVYFLTSYHYNPAGPCFTPLCFVWIGDAEDHTNVVGRVYKSHNLPRMLRLAYQMAADKGLPLAVLSADHEIVELYTKDRAPP